MDKFKVGDEVTIDSGIGSYVIVATPYNFKSRMRNGEWLPAYLYKRESDGSLFSRSQEDAEKRFTIKGYPCANVE